MAFSVPIPFPMWFMSSCFFTTVSGRVNRRGASQLTIWFFISSSLAGTLSSKKGITVLGHSGLLRIVALSVAERVESITLAVLEFPAGGVAS